MELMKVSCTKEDLQALKLIYYNALVALEKKKGGLSYMQAFKFQKKLDELKKGLKNINIDEILEVI